MNWFKNILAYRLTKKLNWENLEIALQSEQFVPCESYDSTSFGWTTPISTSEALSFKGKGQILLIARQEQKQLPSDVVNRELTERVAALEARENRKLKKSERLSIKDDVIAQLLPQAFSKFTHTSVWIDTLTDRIYVDASTSKRAEKALALLRKSLESLPIIPLQFASEPGLILTQWVKNENAGNHFKMLKEIEFTTVEGGKAKFKDQPLDSPEIIALIQQQSFVTKLALNRDDRLSFILQEDSSLKRIKFADYICEANDDILKEDVARRFDADFFLMTQEISSLFDVLLEEFGGIKEIL